MVGTLGTVTGFLVIAIVTWLGTRIGKKNAFFVSTSISMLGYALKWFCYTPDAPMLALLPAPFLAFGLGGLFTLMGSMIADVVDLDELHTGERREGMFGSVFWWMVKLGQSGALLVGGFLLFSTGLDPALGANQPEGTIFWLRFYDAVRAPGGVGDRDLCGVLVSGHGGERGRGEGGAGAEAGGGGWWGSGGGGLRSGGT